MHFLFQPASSDHPELIEIWEDSVRATHFFLSESEISYFKRRILDYYFDMVDLFATKDDTGKILGFMGLSTDKMEMLFIRPEYRGKGIGKELMEHAVQQKNIKLVDVNEQNLQAVGFYQKMGFHVIRRNAIDAEGKPFPILEMELGRK